MTKLSIFKAKMTITQLVSILRPKISISRAKMSILETKFPFLRRKMSFQDDKRSTGYFQGFPLKPNATISPEKSFFRAHSLGQRFQMGGVQFNCKPSSRKPQFSSTEVDLKHLLKLTLPQLRLSSLSRT